MSNNLSSIKITKHSFKKAFVYEAFIQIVVEITRE